MDFIPPADLIDRRIYRIRSRNLVIGAWSAETNGFIGIREKFGNRYLFTEYERDHDPHVGTARAIDDLGVGVPTDVQMRESGSPTCQMHRLPVTAREDAECPYGPTDWGWWVHPDGTPLAKEDYAALPMNQALFDLLVEVESSNPPTSLSSPG